MRNLFFLSLLFVTAGSFAQNINMQVNTGNLPVVQGTNINPPQHMNPETNQAGNDDSQVQQIDEHKTAEGSGEGKKEGYCKECEELKKLKKQQTQQYFSAYTPSGKTRKHSFHRLCLRTNKKMKKIFARDRKRRPNYACFNW